jgi:hypothetical protein
METQKTLNSKSNSEKKVQCWRHHNTCLHAILQTHNNKHSMVLGTKTDRNTNGSQLMIQT